MGKNTVLGIDPFNKDLNLCAGFLVSEYSGRNNLGIIKYQQIPRFKKIYDIIEFQISGFTCITVKRQQSASGAILARILRDQFRRQFKIKIT
jgi:hypothetical protein